MPLDPSRITLTTDLPNDLDAWDQGGSFSIAIPKDHWHARSRRRNRWIQVLDEPIDIYLGRSGEFVMLNVRRLDIGGGSLPFDSNSTDAPDFVFGLEWTVDRWWFVANGRRVGQVLPRSRR